MFFEDSDFTTINDSLEDNTDKNIWIGMIPNNLRDWDKGSVRMSTYCDVDPAD